MLLHATVLTAINNSTALNKASNTLVTSTGDMYTIAGPVLIVLLLTIGIAIGSSVARIEWVHEKLKLFSHTIYYAIVGGASVAAAAVVAYPIWRVAQADTQTKTIALKAIGVVVVGYAALSIIGYVIDRTVLANLETYLDQLDTDSEETAEEDNE